MRWPSSSTPDFTSKWCDQEVGFALARRVPLLPLNFGINPYGFMGKYQADRCEGQAVWQVTRKVTDWLVKTSTARTALAEAVTGALERSPSWDTTRKIMSVLVNLPTFTTDELVRLDQAARSNGEVRDAFFESGSAPDRIKMLIEERGGLPPGPPSDEAPF